MSILDDLDAVNPHVQSYDEEGDSVRVVRTKGSLGNLNEHDLEVLRDWKDSKFYKTLKRYIKADREYRYENSMNKSVATRGQAGDEYRRLSMLWEFEEDLLNLPDLAREEIKSLKDEGKFKEEFYTGEDSPIIGMS